LDFSLGRTPEDFIYAQVIHKIIHQIAGIIDGLIMMPKNLPEYEMLKDIKIWARSDWTSAFNPTIPGKDEVVIPLLNPRYWNLDGISGVVGSLLLGNSATPEADNIQYLATQRSKCYELGIPMAIDLHVLNQNEESKIFNEIVELGLTLAVELGCDMVIVPEGNYLASNKNIGKIVELPILTRFQLWEGMSKNRWSNCWKNILEKVDGIVFTETIYWNEIVKNQDLLEVVQG
jgi:hypothetical protein